MIKSAHFGIFALICVTIGAAEILQDSTGKVSLHYEATNNGINVKFFRDGQPRLSGTLGNGKNLNNLSCIGKSQCKLNEDDDLDITILDNGYKITWHTKNTSVVFDDCFHLETPTIKWYGGPQRYNQVWPLDKMTINGSEPYIIKRSDNFGVAERYWLNSKGVYFWLADSNPLWIDQNNEDEDLVCFRSEIKSPYINRQKNVLEYVVIFLDDPKTAHLHAVNTYLGKPSKYPNEKMVEEPIWTTWAKYKKPINDSVVLEFAKEIRSHGYEGGQLEIDDEWETCYGAQEFDASKFSDINNTVSKLHADNWRVSLWIHPFVDDNCQNNSDIGKESGYFVRNVTNQTLATWWNSENSHQIDFTNPEAAEWWSARLRKLQQSPGIDSFKFDAGEVDYMNQPPVFEDVENSPNILNQKYIETCIQFGDLIEVRSSFRGQKYGEFIRMLDKDSNWGLENGLATLITTLLQLNMNGYTMVLPDMIGGNGYLGQQPTGDLLVRWTQANAFMPSMQFSYLPWEFKSEVTYDIEAIIKKYVDLHAQYAPNITEAMKKSVEDGSPVNPPIWWVDPTDDVALAVSDEFLLGEEILVAPVIVEGSTSRDVYLPKGQWKDGNNGTVYEGPITLQSYNAPIEILPYFIKQ